ncbi:MAG: M16 family metallopeptidase [Prevotella sp.]
MRLNKIILSLMMLLAVTLAAAQVTMPTIPNDKDVRIGKLSNGLTYYIRYNNWPENRAEFYIAQRVGSLQEEENQRGLAHFLEHMCFNGTKHFEGNALIRYCESIGVKFGYELNAYTSIDETVYNISNVPTERRSALDSCLLILYDWADGLLLNPAEIDKERGVIHEEWRMRSTASQRMFERALPKLYPDCKYGLRMPIGLMSVIDNFEPQVLRDYYERWYRPDNQAIIVVGDVDIDHTEAEIKRLFGTIVMPENPDPVVRVSVPDNNEPIVVIEKDKEQRANILYLMIKHEAMPDSLKNTLPYLASQYIKDIAMSMLNTRLSEYARKPESPFVQANAGDDSYLYARTKDAFAMYILPKDGQTEASLAAAYREALRAATYGFTASEFGRAKADVLASLDKAYSNKDKRYNNQFCTEYTEHFLSNEPIPSIDDYYETMKKIIPVIPLEAINKMTRVLVPPTDTNLVVMSMNNEKEGNVYPTEEGLLKAIAEVRGEKLEPYVDNVRDEPLVSVLPKKGSIKKTTENKQLGYKELTLSNGVKVILKQTDFKKDQVMLSADGVGGASLFDEKDYENLKIIEDALDASGLGNFSNNELQKALTGKMVSASWNISQMRTSINASSTPNDMETMMQLVYLMFTKVNKDKESYDNRINTYEISLKNRSLSPESAFSDSLIVTMNCHNPRFSPLTIEQLKRVDYDRILEITRRLTSNAAAYTFTIIGNYDEAALLPLIERYVASLPAQKDVEKSRRVDTDAKGIVVNSFRRKMETPKALSVMIWSADDIPFTLENSVKADVAGQILSMIYLDKIREEASAAYSVMAEGEIRKTDDKTDCSMFVYCPMKPEMSDTALVIMRSEMELMAKTCDAERLNKVKEFLLKNYDDRSKSNSYWGSVITNYKENGVDMHTDYKQIVQSLTPEAVSDFVALLLKAGNRLEVVMLPEE